MNRRAPRSPQDGFTLLEVIIALAILTVGISSAIALFTAATAAHKRAIDRIHASAIAEHAFADIEGALAHEVSPEELLESPPFEEITKNWPGYEVQMMFHVMDGETAEDELLVELRVSWKAEGQTREQLFRQLVVRDLVIK